MNNNFSVKDFENTNLINKTTQDSIQLFISSIEQYKEKSWLESMKYWVNRIFKDIDIRIISYGVFVSFLAFIVVVLWGNISIWAKSFLLFVSIILFISLSIDKLYLRKWISEHFEDYFKKQNLLFNKELKDFSKNFENRKKLDNMFVFQYYNPLNKKEQEELFNKKLWISLEEIKLESIKNRKEGLDKLYSEAIDNIRWFLKFNDIMNYIWIIIIILLLVFMSIILFC